jgi:hypothetical protein
MEDYRYVKFLICDYVRVRRALSRKSASSQSESGIDKFFFDDLSSATIPSNKKRTMMLTVRYAGKQYPCYVGSLERYLKKVNCITI